jgi:hypothetical protein
MVPGPIRIRASPECGAKALELSAARTRQSLERWLKDIEKVVL